MNAHPEDILAPKARVKVADGDGFMLHGSQHKKNRYWRDSEGLPEFEVVACIKRSIQELGRPCDFLQVFVGYTVPLGTEGETDNTGT